MNGIEFQKNYSAFIGNSGAVTTGQANAQRAQKADGNGGDFASLFREKLGEHGELTFSKHALKRIDARQIPVTEKLIERLSGAVEKARDKGVKDALVLSGQSAFLINIPSSTVITALSGREMEESVFTNIDGAVIL